MIPKKPKTLFPQVASELNLSEELVELIVEFYWKEVRKQLTDPEHINVALDSFGFFEIRQPQVQYMVDKYRRIIHGMKLTTYSRHAMMNETVVRLARMEKLLKLCKLQEEKKQQVRLIQKNGKTV